MRRNAPLDRIHYVTLYLLAAPIENTLADFRSLAVELREKDRFHLHRTSHLSGPLAVRSCATSSDAVVSFDAVPYRPNRGVHVRLGVGDADLNGVVDRPGVAGVWTFTGDEFSPPELREVTATWCWLDADPRALAPHLSTDDPHTHFSATLAAVDPFGNWDWFD